LTAFIDYSVESVDQAVLKVLEAQVYDVLVDTADLEVFEFSDKI